MKRRARDFLPPSLMAVFALPLALLLLQPGFAQERTIDPDVEKLLRERLAVLEEVEKLRSEAHRSGLTGFTSVLAANQAVLEAKLELAKNAAERVQVREQFLKNAEMREKALETLAKSAEAQRVGLLSARADRLRAEADLLLERKTSVR